jgi:hypothetical protein
VEDAGAQVCALGCDRDEDCAAGACDLLTGQCSLGPIPDAGYLWADAGGELYDDSCTPYARPVLCSSAESAMRIAALDTQPLTPWGPAGFELHTDGGLSIATVEDALCQGTTMPYAGHDDLTVQYGSTNEISFDYDPCTRWAYAIDIINAHYSGVMMFTSPDGATTYTIGEGLPITAVTGGVTTQVMLNDTTVDQLYRALQATFEPGATPELAGTTCVASGTCRLVVDPTTEQPDHMAFEAFNFSIMLERPQESLTPIVIEILFLTP